MTDVDELTDEHWRTVVNAVEDGEADDRLDALEEADDRDSVQSAIDERRDELDGDEDDDGDEWVTGSDALNVDGIDDVDGHTRLKVRSLNGGHVAGHSFPAGKVKKVIDTPSIRDAIRSGQLQVVSHR